MVGASEVEGKPAFCPRDYEIDSKTAAEVKEDISLHHRLKRSLEETLPNLIFVGPFYVQIEHLRVFLINKRQEIINKLLDLFAARMKRSIEDVPWAFG